MTAELFPVAALGARDCQVIRIRGNANPGKTFSRRSEAAVKVTFAAKPLLCARFSAFALVAQLDRASDFESEGREFESLRARHIVQDFAKRPKRNLPWHQLSACKDCNENEIKVFGCPRLQSAMD